MNEIRSIISQGAQKVTDKRHTIAETNLSIISKKIQTLIEKVVALKLNFDASIEHAIKNFHKIIVKITRNLKSRRVECGEISAQKQKPVKERVHFSDKVQICEFKRDEHATKVKSAVSIKPSNEKNSPTAARTAKNPSIEKNYTDKEVESVVERSNEVLSKIQISPITSYEKGKEKTRMFVPTIKKNISSGGIFNIGVFVLDKEKLLKENPNSPLLQLNSELVVKKAMGEMYNEFEIGNTLNHPNIVHSHALFEKKIIGNNTERVKHKIVMDKVNGTPLTTHFKRREKLPREVVEKLLESAKETCLYLFDKRVKWCDVNDGNIFVEEGTQSLKILDFGAWDREEDLAKLTYGLMLGSMEVVGWMLKSSHLYSEGRNRRDIFPVLYPDSLIGIDLKPPQILSIAGEIYRDLPIGKTIESAIQESANDPEKLKEYLASYFDQVLKLYRETP